MRNSTDIFMAFAGIVYSITAIIMMISEFSKILPYTL